MPGFSGEIVVGCSPEVAFDFAADERNEPTYNPRMVRAEKVTDGPIGAGTRFLAATTFMGRTTEMVIEWTGYDRPRRLASRTTMPSMEIEGALTFEPHPSGTRMRWSWEIMPRGALRLAGPPVSFVGKRQEARIWGSMKRVLEGTG